MTRFDGSTALKLDFGGMTATTTAGPMTIGPRRVAAGPGCGWRAPAERFAGRISTKFSSIGAARRRSGHGICWN